MEKRIRTDFIIIHSSEKGDHHFIIEENGKLNKGVKLKHIGKHAGGHDRYSVSICLEGNDLTEEQILTLNNILDNLIQIYPSAKIVGHNEIHKDKKCPGFNLIDYVPLVEEQRARVSYVQEARSRRRGRSNKSWSS